MMTDDIKAMINADSTAEQFSIRVTDIVGVFGEKSRAIHTEFMADMEKLINEIDASKLPDGLKHALCFQMTAELNVAVESLS